MSVLPFLNILNSYYLKSLSRGSNSSYSSNINGLFCRLAVSSQNLPLSLLMNDMKYFYRVVSYSILPLYLANAPLNPSSYSDILLICSVCLKLITSLAVGLIAFFEVVDTYLNVGVLERSFPDVYLPGVLLRKVTLLESGF